MTHVAFSWRIMYIHNSSGPLMTNNFSWQKWSYFIVMMKKASSRPSHLSIHTLSLLRIHWAPQEHGASSGYIEPSQDTLRLLRIHIASSGYTQPPRDTLSLLRIHSASSGYTQPPRDTLSLLRMLVAYSGNTELLRDILSLLKIHWASSGYTEPP